MNEIETLHAIRTQLEGRDSVLARHLELLEREREIVRREIDVVAELMGLEEQRVAAEVGPVVTPGPDADGGPVQAHVSPSTSASPAPGQENQPERLAASGPELKAGPAVALVEAAADRGPAAEPEAWPERPAPAMAESPSLTTLQPEPATAQTDRGQFDGAPAVVEPRDTEMLGRIEQLRRLRASLVVGSPAASSGRGD